jgi:hypothetical protein
MDYIQKTKEEILRGNAIMGIDKHLLTPPPSLYADTYTTSILRNIMLETGVER